MSLREFVTSLWHYPRKNDARAAYEEWLTISERLRQLQEPVKAPSHDFSPQDPEKRYPAKHDQGDRTLR